MHIATVQPMGHAHQIPMEPKTLASPMASATRRIRSVKVAIMKFFIRPAPRRMPSATSFAETTK